MDIAALEAAPPTCIELIGLRCEAEACAAASAGVLPIELASAAGTKAGAKRRAFCEQRANAIAKSLPQESAARAALGSAEFKGMAVAFCFFKV